MFLTEALYPPEEYDVFVSKKGRMNKLLAAQIV